MNTSPPPQLADLLEHHIRRTNRIFTPGLLAKFSGVPKTTIINWLTGRVARPRRWQDLAKVADALRLSEADVNALLTAAGHPPLADLATQVADPKDRALLAAWVGPRQSPPPRPISRSVAALPLLPTSLIGREREQAAVRAALEQPEVRLLTLTGTGGAGKTRLALQAAIDLQPMFADGVVYVMLAPVADPALVGETIATALSVRMDDEHTLIGQLHDALAAKQMLLVLDNFEHIAAAAPLLTDLLRAAPRIKLLVTSRVVLHLYGEHVFDVPPLPLPNLDRLPPVAELATNPAVALFVQRAQAVDRTFRLHTANARTIAEICARLDGLPLSIELAAARSKLLAPHTLLARLATRLGVLTWGARDLPTRHQTLRATLDWSYRLLRPSTRTLFARLAVFHGAFALDAAEAICGDDEASATTHTRPSKNGLHPTTILDELMVLVDSSLIQNVPTGDDEKRFRMLQTIREYALEHLVAAGEEQQVQERYAAYYLGLAEAAEPALMGVQQAMWLMLLHREHDNLRAALNWLLQHNAVEAAARLAAALRPFWMIRGHLGEGRRWLDLVLHRREAIGEQVLAKTYLAAGRLARQQGDLASAEALLNESLTLHHALNDRAGTAAVLGYLGVLAYDRCDWATAAALHTQSLALRRDIGDRWGIAATLGNLGEVTRQGGDYDRALELHEESLIVFQQLGDQWGVAAARINLATTHCDRGDGDRAQRLFLESADGWQQLDDREGLAECVEGLACVAAATGQYTIAVQLAGAAAAVRSAIEAPLSPADRRWYEHYLARARDALDAAAYNAAWTYGSTLTLAQAIALVTAE